MNLKQVKKHFKNAKEVKCPYDNMVYNIDVNGRFDKHGQDIHFSLNDFQHGQGSVCLWYEMKLAEIISYKDTSQGPEEKEYPKVMLVSENKMEWSKRVVFMKKNNYFLAWDLAETMEESESRVTTMNWRFAKELPKEIEVTKEEIAKWKGCDVEQLIIK